MPLFQLVRCVHCSTINVALVLFSYHFFRVFFAVLLRAAAANVKFKYYPSFWLTILLFAIEKSLANAKMMTKPHYSVANASFSVYLSVHTNLMHSMGNFGRYLSNVFDGNRLKSFFFRKCVCVCGMQ